MFSVLWQFRSTLVVYRRELTIGGVLILLGSALALALPWPLKIVVDNVLQDRPFGPLSGPPLLWTCIAAICLVAGSPTPARTPSCRPAPGSSAT